MIGFSAKKISFSWIMVLCLPLLLGAGSKTPDTAPANSKVLVYPLSTDPKSFNPVFSQETSSSAVLSLLFEGLTRFNPVDESIEPWLAQSWTHDASGKIWDFQLRRDVKWFDGKSFTARDVAFTFNELIFNPELPVPARDIFQINGQPIKVEIKGKYEVRFLLPEPFAPFLFALNQAIYPEHVFRPFLEKSSLVQAWNVSAPPQSIVGTGPFMLKRYLPGEKVELIKNPLYWKKDARNNSLPYLDKIIMPVIPHPDTQLLKFLQGELDIYGARGEDIPLLRREKVKRGFDLLYTGAEVGSDFLALNQTVPNTKKQVWFRDARFRKAVASAIDRQAMIDIVYNRQALPQCSPVSPSIARYHEADIPCEAYDLEKAARLLRESGYADRDKDGWIEDKTGERVEFNLITNSENTERVQTASMIRDDLTKLGIKVNFQPLEFNHLVNKLMAQKDWDAVVIGLTGSPDPHFGVNVWKSSGTLHFWNNSGKPLEPWEQEVDDIFSQAAVTINEAERKALYGRWQRIIQEQMPLIYTVLAKRWTALRPRFKNIQPTVLGGIFHNIHEIDIAEEAETR